MKKIAIIGSSNTVIHNSYTKKLVKLYQDQCDVYALGASTSIFAIFTILEKDIINNYEHIILQTSVVETIELNIGTLNKYTIISYLLFIISKFYKSNSCLTFLLIPDRNFPITSSSSYIYRALASIYDIDIIDMESSFITIDNKTLMSDDLRHLNDQYQEITATHIEQHLNIKKTIEKKIENCIEFQLVDQQAYQHLDDNYIGTSLLRRKTYILQADEKLELPNDKYLCGLFIWIQNDAPYLVFKNSCITLAKALNFFNFKPLFRCCSIGWSVFNGLRGGELFISKDLTNKCYERVFGGNIHSKQDNYIEITNLLLSTKSPNEYGLDYYNKNSSSFEKAYEVLINLSKRY